MDLYNNERMMEKYTGVSFTFFRFLDLIVQVAHSSFSDPFFSRQRVQSLTLAEMGCMLLERMELSNGFMMIEKKSHRTHTSKVTLLPSRNVITTIQLAKEALYQEQ